MLDLKDYKHSIFGIQGSGKTVLAKFLMRGFKKPVVYRVNADFDSENVYLYRPVDLYGELNNFCKWLKDSDNDLFILDEADLFLSSNNLLNYPELNDLVINHRHYKKTMIFISRRPQDIPTKIVESCRYTFWFKLEGANISRKLNEIDERLLEMMEQLQFKDYRFIIKPIGESPTIHQPVTN